MVQWGIYLATIGFVEGGNTKIRPLLVLNEPVGDYEIVIVAPIYIAKDNHILAGDIQINTPGRLAMGLVRPSTARLHRMVAMPLHDLKEKLGDAPIDIQKAVKENFKTLFDL